MNSKVLHNENFENIFEMLTVAQYFKTDKFFQVY